MSQSRRLVGAVYFWIASAGAVSAAAWLGSLVLIAWYFYLITPISLLANLCVVPLAFAILAVGLLSLLAAPISPGLTLDFQQRELEPVAACPRAGAGLFANARRTSATSSARIGLTTRSARSRCSIPALVPRSTCARVARTGFSTQAVRATTKSCSAITCTRAGSIDSMAWCSSHGDSLHLGGAAPTLEEFQPGQFLDNATPDRSRVHHALLVRHPTLLARGNSVSISQSVRAEILFPPAGFQSEGGRRPGARDPADDRRRLACPPAFRQRPGDGGHAAQTA